MSGNIIVPKSEENDPQEKLFLKDHGIMILPKVSIFDFTPITQLMESIHFANDNFNRINRNNK